MHTSSTNVTTTSQPNIDNNSIVTIPHTSSPTPTRRRNNFLTLTTGLLRRHAKLLPLIISVSVGLLVRFAIPKPSRVTTKAWQLLAIFLTTISGLILSPLPVGAWSFACLTLVVVTDTLSFAQAFIAFTNEVIWLIVASFFFSRGFVKTGLGDRIAMYFVKWLGKSSLGLAYGLALSEAMIAPAMPSTTARAGGIFVPIINSLSRSADSLPKDHSSNKLGAFLIHSQFQVQSSFQQQEELIEYQNYVIILLKFNIYSMFSWYHGSKHDSLRKPELFLSTHRNLESNKWFT